jgi:hypothetical protein
VYVTKARERESLEKLAADTTRPHHKHLRNLQTPKPPKTKPTKNNFNSSTESAQ